MYRERVLAVSYLARGVPPSGGVGTFAVRIARADPAARDGYRLGPIVMTYPQCSDCGAEWIYGDGSLWLYDAVNGRGPSPGELVRVSATSGRVQQQWAMPEIIRALLAVDADCLWLAPSNQSGGPPTLHPTAAQRPRYDSLYHVAPGARPAAVFRIGSGGALWLVAAGHTVWLDANGIPRGSALWRLQGPHATPLLHGQYPGSTNQGAEFRAGAPTYAGNAAIGIYYVAAGSATNGSCASPLTHQASRASPPSMRPQATPSTAPPRLPSRWADHSTSSIRQRSPTRAATRRR